MLYHYQERKGCVYGLKALKIVKERYPQLKAVFFGTPKRPSDLPDWISYYQCPDKETHNRIYNNSAIYLAPSLQEGWGLTVGEAMICGAVPVCTDTLGFHEMVTDGENGFIVPVKDVEKMAKRIILLIENDSLRFKLAHESVKTMSRFSWKESFIKLEMQLCK